MNKFFLRWLLLLGFSVFAGRVNAEINNEPEFIKISKDGRHFARANSGRQFVPWGFNYDHDAKNHLLEEYWDHKWDAVVGDFEEMKRLGATVVRIHLQVSRFMKSATEPNRKALAQLTRLLALAEKTGLYLDVTGLGCYDKSDVPRWYNKLGEQDRWDVQARFWQAVARTCKDSPAVFCYDLMNEPVLSEDKKGRDWTPGVFGNRYFVQRLTLDFKGRTQIQIAEAWVDKLVTAVRAEDSRHLITVGAIPFALTFPNAKPIIYSPQASKRLDFVSVHFYPYKNKIDKALTALAVYDIGKPIVIEEIFPLNAPINDLDQFINGSKRVAAGWISFYWGKTIEEYKRSKRTIPESMTMEWLEYFARKTPEIVGANN
jgi:hypothetical protein